MRNRYPNHMFYVEPPKAPDDRLFEGIIYGVLGLLGFQGVVLFVVTMVFV